MQIDARKKFFSNSKRIGVAYRSKAVIRKKARATGTYFRFYIPNAFEIRVAELVNDERVKAGRRPLEYVVKTRRVCYFTLGKPICLPFRQALPSITNTLGGCARLKSQDMRDKNYFGHTSPTYGTPLQMLQRYGLNLSNGRKHCGGLQYT